ncbi:hypothetical protein B0T14DRAFT_314567 [Immersiella caudata]|uniref:Uncharacterized protein n=1 Tax=Immersiella caudata TaxID=314043 RepID=A0AA39WAS9_9PEZI|nr:hypothetical protein B0T14DRAFT_314567 [Immersiella caudata]
MSLGRVASRLHSTDSDQRGTVPKQCKSSPPKLGTPAPPANAHANPCHTDAQPPGVACFRTQREHSIKDNLTTTSTTEFNIESVSPIPLNRIKPVHHPKKNLTKMHLSARSGGVGKAFTAADAVTKSISLGTAIAIPLAIVFAVIIAFIVFTVCRSRKKKARKAKEERDEAYDRLTASARKSEADRRRPGDSDWDSDEEAELKSPLPTRTRR